MSAPLDIRNLTLDYAVDGGAAQVLRGVSLTAKAGQVVGIVGESGCGKSTLALAMMGLLPRNARLRGGEVLLEGQDLLSMTPAQQRQKRGQGIGMIFQDPMTAFNPVLTLGRQLVDDFHGREARSSARRHASSGPRAMPIARASNGHPSTPADGCRSAFVVRGVRAVREQSACIFIS